MIDTKKGKLTRWSAESALWYEKASEYTGYHDKIWQLISSSFRPEFTVCELACGTGTLARKIAPHVMHVTINDVDFDALIHCRQIIVEEDIKNMSIMQGDWKKECVGEYDIILFSYFSAIVGDWDKLSERCHQKIIAILPTNQLLARRGETQDVRDRTKNYPEVSEESSDLKSIHDVSKRETYEDVCHFLDERHIPYEAIPLTIDFGQPFSDLEEAKKYIKYYYEINDEKELEAFIQEKVKPISSGYYFPKIKDIGIVIINLASYRSRFGF